MNDNIQDEVMYVETERNENFFITYNAFARNPNVNGNDFKVWSVIRSYVWGTNGWKLSLSTIAQSCGISISTAKKSIKWLCDNGFIIKIKRKKQDSNENDCNIYKMVAIDPVTGLPTGVEEVSKRREPKKPQAMDDNTVSERSENKVVDNSVDKPVDNDVDNSKTDKNVSQNLTEGRAESNQRRLESNQEVGQNLTNVGQNLTSNKTILNKNINTIVKEKKEESSSSTPTPNNNFLSDTERTSEPLTEVQKESTITDKKKFVTDEPKVTGNIKSTSPNSSKESTRMEKEFIRFMEVLKSGLVVNTEDEEQLYSIYKRSNMYLLQKVVEYTRKRGICSAALIKIYANTFISEGLLTKSQIDDYILKEA
jgi:hypothetical protein